ncbi:hypothetical protein D9M71_241910 [compost metagenome]
MVVTDLGHQGQAAGAQDLVVELGGGQLSLVHRHLLVAFDGCARCIVGMAGAENRPPGVLAQRGQVEVGGVDLQWHVRPVADLATQGRTACVGLQAQAIQMDVFGVIDVVARGADGAERIARRGQGRVVALHTQKRAAAVVVQGIGTELGFVQLWHEPAQCHAILAAVSGVVVFQAGNIRIIDKLHADGSRATGVARNARGKVLALHHQAVVAALGEGIGAEKGAAVVDHGFFPLDLVEGFGGDVFAQALGHIQHVDRDQAFLDLGARPAQGGYIDRVDRVDAVADKGAFTPADHLLAQAHITRQLAEGVVVVNEGIEELGTGRLGHVLAATVVDIVEVLVAILELEVIPVLAAQEGAAVAVFQLQVVNALEDCGKIFAGLEVLATVVEGARSSLATGNALAVEVGNEVLVGTCGRPTSAH